MQPAAVQRLRLALQPPRCGGRIRVNSASPATILTPIQQKFGLFSVLPSQTPFDFWIDDLAFLPRDQAR